MTTTRDRRRKVRDVGAKRARQAKLRRAARAKIRRTERARARRVKVARTAARVAVGASVAAVPLVGGPGAPAEPAAAYTGRAATMNICSAACHVPNANKYRDFWGHTYLRNSVYNQGNSSPWAIGATEVCGLSHLYLDGQFQAHRRLLPDDRLQRHVPGQLRRLALHRRRGHR